MKIIYKCHKALARSNFCPGKLLNGIHWEEHSLWHQRGLTWNSGLATGVTGCVTLGQLLNLSMLQFHL